MRTAEKERLRRLGVQVPDILLPAPDVSPETFAVVACDQYTSQPDYWNAVSRQVGSSPSIFSRRTFSGAFRQPGDAGRSFSV